MEALSARRKIGPPALAQLTSEFLGRLQDLPHGFEAITGVGPGPVHLERTSLFAGSSGLRRGRARRARRE
jgi:hypothetical protein